MLSDQYSARGKIGKDSARLPSPVPAITAFHERDLIDADGAKEAGELRECLFAEGAAAIEIIAAHLIAVSETLLVLVHIAGETARNGPVACPL